MKARNDRATPVVRTAFAQEFGGVVRTKYQPDVDNVKVYLKSKHPDMLPIEIERRALGKHYSSSIRTYPTPSVRLLLLFVATLWPFTIFDRMVIVQDKIEGMMESKLKSFEAYDKSELGKNTPVCKPTTVWGGIGTRGEETHNLPALTPLCSFIWLAVD